METADILNLDIRAIVPLYKVRGNFYRPDVDRDVPLKDIDLGLFSLENGFLSEILIKGGWGVLSEVKKSKYQNIFYFPTSNAVRFPNFLALLNAKVNKTSRFSEEVFSELGDKFIEHYVFRRFEEEVNSASEYIKLKQDGLDLDLKPEGGTRFFDEWAKKTNRLRDLVLNDPALVMLPKPPINLYPEVRLDNKLNKCISVPDQYEKLFVYNDNSPNTALTICDLVLEHEDGLHIVEFKVTEKAITYNKKAKRQLIRAALFFKTNFGTDAYLDSILMKKNDSGQDRLVTTQYKLDGIHLIKIGKKEVDF